MPSAVRGHRASQRRSPRSVIAHTWKNALCRVNADILSVHGLSSSLSPEHAFLSNRIISGAATGRRPFHLNQRTECLSGGGSRPCGPAQGSRGGAQTSARSCERLPLFSVNLCVKHPLCSQLPPSSPRLPPPQSPRPPSRSRCLD